MPDISSGPVTSAAQLTDSREDPHKPGRPSKQPASAAKAETKPATEVITKDDQPHRLDVVG